VQSFAMLLNAQGTHTAYQVALVDQRQLDMDPVQFATSVRSEPSLQDVTMVLIAPPCPAKRREQLLSVGYCRILDTPIDKRQLFNALHTAGRVPPAVQSAKVLDLTRRIEERSKPLAPKEILVAETSEFTRRSISRILERAGHHVFSVTNGEEALDALEHHHFDLAIVESEMQVISGIQVVKLHNFTRPVHQWLPFILLTRSRSPVLMKQCENTRACAILLKPIRGPELQEVVARIAQSEGREINGLADGAESGAAAALHNRFANPPALDETVLAHLEQIGPAEGFLDKLVEQFVIDGEQLISQLDQAVETGDYDTYKDCAHHLIDNSSYMGAVALFEYSSSGARVGRAEFPGNAAGLTSEIREAYQNARQALREFLRKRSDSAAGR
jgi:two-component system sensor histidine kinase RpfC